MERLARAVRRALYGLVLAAAGQFLFDGIDLFGIRSGTLRAVEVILAIVLLFGIIPGSYLSVILRRLSDRVSEVSSRRAGIIAIGVPLLLLSVQTYFIIGDLPILERIDDPRLQASLWYSLAMGIIQLVILALNVVNVFKSASQESSS